MLTEPRGPPNNSIFKSSKGTCGVFVKLVATRSVLSFNSPLPASFTSTPDTGSSATIYNDTNEPNGFRPASPFGAGAARYTEPSNSCESNGVLIRTSPTFEASGHDGKDDLNSWVCVAWLSPR